MEVCLIMLSRLSAANSHDRLIEEPDNRGPDKRGCTASNDSHFALGESILITFYEARICFELNLFWLVK